MESLKSIRSVAKGQITKLKNYAHEKSNIANIFELNAKLELLETYYKKFDAAQTRIEEEDEKEILSNERDIFDEDYCATKSKLLSAISDLTPSESNQHNSSIIQTRYNVELPRLPLPVFNGDFS